MPPHADRSAPPVSGGLSPGTRAGLGLGLSRDLWLALVLWLGLGLFATVGSAAAGGPSEATGPYLGIEPPGAVPEIFAPGVVSGVHHEHSAAVFSPDGRDLWWTLIAMPLQGPAPGVVVHSGQGEDGRWSRPEVAPFSGRFDDDVCSISPDGNRLYLSSRRPRGAGDPPAPRSDIWVVERTSTGWGEPRPLAGSVNTEYEESSFQETLSGAAYYVGHLEGVRGERGIFRARSTDGAYGAPEALGPRINSEHLDWCPFVDPAEELLLFSSDRPGGSGALDLYVSFRRPDGEWAEPVNLGAGINTAANERFPRLSPDGKYLFFTSNRTMGAEGPPDAPLTLDDLEAQSRSINNGLSNVYWVDASFLGWLRARQEVDGDR